MDPIVLVSIIKICLWIACAVIGAKLMRQKNRSDVVGCLLGVFLGLIGLIIILFIPTKNIDADVKVIKDIE